MLRAAQIVVDEGIAQPILIGRPAVIEARLQRFGLAIRPGRDFILINPQEDPRYRKYVDLYIEAAGRRGVTPDAARTVIAHQLDRSSPPPWCGPAMPMRPSAGSKAASWGHLRHIRDLIGTAPGVDDFAALSLLITGQGDTSSSPTPRCGPDPTAEEIAEVAVLAAAHIRRFGHRAQDRPRLAFRFRQLRQPDGPQDAARDRSLVAIRKVDFEVDGEMHADYRARPGRSAPGSIRIRG